MKLRVTSTDQPSSDRVCIIVPVLNEVGRIERCLAALNSQPEEVSEILVVDGGSSDGTQEIIHRFASRDARVRLIDASPIDPRWTGKAWGLNFGLQLTSPASQWILTLDADVEAKRLLVRSLIAHANRTGISAFSLATRQVVADWVDAIIHPAMLTTLVYRFGAPGGATANRHGPKDEIADHHVSRCAVDLGLPTSRPAIGHQEPPIARRHGVKDQPVR